MSTTLSLNISLLTLGDCTQHEDAGLFDDPVRVEKQAFEEGQEMRKQLIPKHVGQHIERCSRTLPCRGRFDPYFLRFPARPDVTLKMRIC